MAGLKLLPDQVYPAPAGPLAVKLLEPPLEMGVGPVTVTIGAELTVKLNVPVLVQTPVVPTML